MFNSVFYRHVPYLTGLAVLLMIAVAMPAIALEIEAETEKAPEAEKAQVKWGTSIEEAMKQSAETGKPVMMDFYTEW